MNFDILILPWLCFWAAPPKLSRTTGQRDNENPDTWPNFLQQNQTWAISSTQISWRYCKPTTTMHLAPVLQGHNFFCWLEQEQGPCGLFVWCFLKTRTGGYSKPGMTKPKRAQMDDHDHVAKLLPWREDMLPIPCLAHRAWMPCLGPVITVTNHWLRSVPTVHVRVRAAQLYRHLTAQSLYPSFSSHQPTASEASSRQQH